MTYSAEQMNHLSRALRIYRHHREAVNDFMVELAENGLIFKSKAGDVRIHFEAPDGRKFAIALTLDEVK